MKIAFTPRFQISPFSTLYYSYEHQLIEGFAQLGGIFEPILLIPENKHRLQEAEVLILGGGETPGFNSKRDDFEKSLIELALKIEIPIIGICRGAQLLGVLTSNQLITIVNHVNEWRVLDDRETHVKCFHQFGFSHLSPDWKILARDSKDGSIELFQHHSKPIVGILSHPERQNDSKLALGKLLSILGLN